jgi:hypothetical protein
VESAIEWVLDLSLEIYEWISEAIDGLLGYLEEVLNFVDDFPDMLEDFFSSAFSDMRNLVSSLNPKDAVEGFGKKLEGF